MPSIESSPVIETIEAFVIAGDKDYAGGAGLVPPGQLPAASSALDEVEFAHTRLKHRTAW